MVSRRGMLCAALAGSLVPPATLQWTLGPRPSGAGWWRLADLAGDARSAAHVGEAILERHPELADAGLLESAMRQRGLLFGDFAQSRPDARRRYSIAVRQDFGEGRTVDCDGWQLAQTEAYLCALIALGVRPS